MKYRPEIDGLRALAVLPVILFHANFPMFGGGYVGVDVFFVISGFLISRIVFSEVNNGTFSLVHFYERRARRILPALFALVIIVAPIASLVMMPHQLKDFAESVVAVSLFSANILFWLESGYFELASELKPLLHTWSLAVEEQFYFVFPITVMAIYRFFPRMMLPIVALIFMLSFGWSQHIALTNPEANFYLPFSRAWELACGSLAALYVVNPAPTKPGVSGFLAGLGLIMILASVFLLDRTTPFPSEYALPVVVGTVLVIIFANPANVAGRILSMSANVSIGRISYSLYLWHFPVFALARLILNAEPSSGTYLALIVLVFPIAYSSYRYVESPFRNKDLFSRNAIFLAATCGLGLFVALGYSGHRTNGLAALKFAQIPIENQDFLVDIARERSARSLVWQPLLNAAGRPFDTNRSRTVLIVGDSVSEDLYVALSLVRESFPDFSFRQLRLDTGCMRYLTQTPSTSSFCNDQIRAVSESELTDNASLILVSATWRQQTVDDVEGVIHYFDHPGKKIIVFGSANFNDVASLTYQIAQQSIPRSEWGSFFAGNKRTDWNRQNQRLKLILDRSNATYISKYDIFCRSDALGEECDLVNDNGEALIYDTGHLTVAGAYFMNRRFQEVDWLEN